MMNNDRVIEKIKASRREIAVYVHIPFCEKKCNYCDFCSFTNGNQKQYFDFLIKEIDECKEDDAVVSSVFFGGGTPSFVLEDYIKLTLDTLRTKFEFKPDAEISIECNPNSASLEKLQCYIAIGINRISFGVQSLNDKILDILGRVHNAKQAMQCVKIAKQAGFERISVDLMLGLPNQKYKDIKKAVKYFANNVSHISAYTLQLEENTKLFKMVEQKTLVLPSDDIVAKQYQFCAKLLKKYGFFRYEISNFAKKGQMCKHNLTYWKMKEYIGFGVAASSFLGGKRITNSDNLDDYFANAEKVVEVLTNEQKITEHIMLGLRCCFGFSLAKIKHLGKDLTFYKNFNDLLLKKMIYVDEDRVFLNPEYYEVSNLIISKLLDF